MLPKKYVITIGRTFGSGGRDLGKAIADRLGIGFYDGKLLEQAAMKAGLNRTYTEQNDEKAPSILSGIIPFSMGFNPTGWFAGSTSSPGGEIYKAQCDFIHELAEAEPCVIVGRSADYVLRDIPALVNLFVHAPGDDCIRRILQRGEAQSAAEARSLSERKNRQRREFYEFYTDKQWGHAASYHLCLDSSTADIDTLAQFAIQFINHRLG